MKKTKKSVLTIRKRFRSRNARFRKLTRADQRIKIIKDVISLLKSRKIIPTQHSGSYISISAEYTYNKKDQLNEVLDDKTCTVCGIGGLFVSAVSLHNNLIAGDIGYLTSGADGTRLKRYLQNWFDIKQLGLIECAFEDSHSFAAVSSPQKAIWDARHFGSQWGDPKERLLKICENILDNKGIFKPAQRIVIGSKL